MLNCPICGRKVEIDTDDWRYIIECDCGLKFQIEDCYNKEALIEAWNKQRGVNDFAEWLEEMDYLNEVDIDYDWNEEPYELVNKITKEYVMSQYLECIKDDDGVYTYRRLWW